MIKKIFLFLLAVFVILQFFHPSKNQAEGAQPNRLASKFNVPADVQDILAKACNDCHTNNTRYPWYTRIQPVDWWITDHINEGKKELNLDEYTHRNLRFQYHKLEEIAEQVKEGLMPLESYTWIHKDAILTEQEKTTLISWADGLRSEMEAQYPMDSLIRKK